MVSPVLAQAILGQQAPDVLGQFRAGQAEAREDESRRLAGEVAQAQFGTGKIGQLAKTDPAMAAQLAQALDIPVGETARLQSFAKDLQIANGLAAADPQRAVQFMFQRRDKLNKMGIKTPTINEFLSKFSQDPESALNDLDIVTEAVERAGLIPPAPEDKVLTEVRKELRGELRKTVGELSKTADTIETNRSKVVNLASRVKAGSRTAVAPMLVSLVKLGDPGSVVSEAEQRSILNAANPLAAALDVATQRGDGSEGFIRSILQRVDTLGPDNIDVDEVIRTADALVSANIPAVQEGLETARVRGEQGLTQRGFSSIFSDRLNKRVAGLSRLIPQAQPEPAPAPAAPAAAPQQVGRFQVQVVN